jgi:hypothetical protein
MNIIIKTINRKMANVSQKIERSGDQVQVRTKDSIRVDIIMADISFIERNLLDRTIFVFFDENLFFLLCRYSIVFSLK